jgi:hypothetical protein
VDVRVPVCLQIYGCRIDRHLLTSILLSAVDDISSIFFMQGIHRFL